MSKRFDFFFLKQRHIKGVSICIQIQNKRDQTKPTFPNIRTVECFTPLTTQCPQYFQKPLAHMDEYFRTPLQCVSFKFPRHIHRAMM
jgi:hypothetical protein